MSEDDFDNQMKKLGVRRLGDARNAGQRTVRIARDARAGKVGAKSGRDAAPRSESGPSGAETEELQAALDAAKRQASEVNVELEALRQALSTAESGKEEAEARCAQLLSELEEPLQGSTSLKEALFERGVLGADEQKAAFEGLFQRGKWQGILPMLRVDRPERLRERLSEDLFLHCGTKRCRRPQSVVCLDVVPERCEICGGADWEANTASDAMLLNGYRTLVVYGGHPHHHALLREALDSRIRFRSAPGGQSSTKSSPAKGELRVYWGGTRSDPAHAQPTDASGIGISESNLAGMLRGVVSELRRR